MKAALVSTVLILGALAGSAHADPSSYAVVGGKGDSYRVVHAADGSPVQAEVFYLEMGRPDLLEAYRENRRTNAIITGAGGVAAGLGVGLILTDLLVNAAAETGDQAIGAVTLCPTWASPEECNFHESDHTMAYIGAGVAAVGLVAVVVGLSRDPRPIDASGARQLISRVNVAPTLGRDRAGLSATLRF